ncbi:MAG: hypothetical protein ACJ72E_11165 [Marmoricola sp.]
MLAGVDLRFPAVPLGRPHYESVYCALVHPVEPRALWIRTTVRKRPGEQPQGAVWVTWFDEQGVRAAKLDDLDVAPGGLGITCGPATQGPSGLRGEVTGALSCRWDLNFAATAEPLRHLHPERLYSAPLPRTKATSPLPDLDVAGFLVVDGEPVDLTGWTGMLGHNWGTEHAARWVWMRAAGLGEDGRGWLDAIVGRARVGPLLAPWTAFGTLELEGRRHRLGGLLTRGAAVDVHPGGALITLPGKDVRVMARATVPPGSTVGSEYRDPSGHRHEVVNCSVTAWALDVAGAGRPRTFDPVRRGVLELGGDGRALDIPLQPFGD